MSDAARTGGYREALDAIAEALDAFERFEHPDALARAEAWRAALDVPLPQRGAGLGDVIDALVRDVIPNGSPLVRPGFTGFITTGGTTASTLATTAASVASPQRYGLTAFNLLEDVSLRWLSQMLGIAKLAGVYSSGGSTANLLAIGAARQWAFERAGRDPAAQGVDRPVAVYASTEAHHTIQRSAGVLGIGRRSVRAIGCDSQGRLSVSELRLALDSDLRAGVLPVAIVANAGTTNTGAIDPIAEIAQVAKDAGAWLHVDGAYGLPGILDDRKAPLYRGLEHADSVIVDPHKWLGASVGVAATFVRDREILKRAFTQEPADYLEGNASDADAISPEHSLDHFGVPYFDYGVELSAPCRGVVVWAMIREIGVDGMRERVRRHNDMASWVAGKARTHPNLELLVEPTLSVCCFRYVAPGAGDLDVLNRRLHRRLIRENRNLPSTTVVDGKLALRPCFIGARTTQADAQSLVEDVLRIGAEVARESS